MNIKTIIIAILNLFSIMVWGQSNKPCYCRMEGTIGDNIELTANFIKLFDKVEGNYQYKFKDDNNKMFYGKKIDFEGNIKNSDSLLIKEFGAPDFTFKGRMKSHVFTGEWLVPDDNKTLEVKLKEYYPLGSMKFEVNYLNSEKPLIANKKESPAASLELLFVSPKDYNNPAISDSVKKAIMLSFFGANFSLATPKEMMKKFEEEYYQNYIKSNFDIYSKDSTGSSFSWLSEKKMSIIYNSDYLLSIEYLKYAYTGGAHGITNYSYDVINLNTGKTLTYKDIFKDDSDSILVDLLTGTMLEKYKTKEESNLREIGFWVDSITPNNNIYITGNGIGFRYASYEIAPFSFGPPEIFLNFDQIKEFIKPGTPVFKISHQNRQ